MKTENLSPATIGRLLLQTIQTIILVRHAKAPKTSPEQKDEDRQLNLLGHEQAGKLGLKLHGLEFDLVLSSPLQRVKQTLAIATVLNPHPVIEIPELTCPTDGVHPIDVMFNAPGMGYVPLTQYFEHPLGEHLKVWGRTALEAVAGELTVRPRQQVLVGGHAVLQNALAWAIGEAVEEASHDVGFSGIQQMALNETLSDGEAFVLTLDASLIQNGVAAKHLRLD